MRIISGNNRGKVIIAPKKLPVRPTTDMAKEALFNIINNTFDYDTISVLDLFSGTGNISYEFASRGTSNIVAVDSNFHCISFIKKVATELDFPIHCFKTDVFGFLEKQQSSFDIIFADPPYHLPISDFEKIPALVFKNQLLSPNGLLVVEHSKQTPLENLPYFLYQRNYGNSTFSFFGWE